MAKEKPQISNNIKDVGKMWEQKKQIEKDLEKIGDTVDDIQSDKQDFDTVAKTNDANAPDAIAAIASAQQVINKITKTPDTEPAGNRKLLEDTSDLIFNIDENIRKEGYTKDYLDDHTSGQLKLLLEDLKNKKDKKNIPLVTEMINKKITQERTINFAKKSTDAEIQEKSLTALKRMLPHLEKNETNKLYIRIEKAIAEKDAHFAPKNSAEIIKDEEKDDEKDDETPMGAWIERNQESDEIKKPETTTPEKNVLRDAIIKHGTPQYEFFSDDQLLNLYLENKKQSETAGEKTTDQQRKIISDLQESLVQRQVLSGPINAPKKSEKNKDELAIVDATPSTSPTEKLDGLSQQELWKKFSNNRSVDNINFSSDENKKAFLAWQKKDQASDPEKYTAHDESKTINQETLTRSSSHLGILEKRRKNFQQRNLDIRNALKDKNLNPQERGQLENQQLLALEKIRTLEHRIGKTEKQISRYKNRNEGMFSKMGARIGLAAKKFSRWIESPQNRRKLMYRVAGTVAAATIMGFALPAIGGVTIAGYTLGATSTGIGGFAASFAGGYAGGEAARGLYNKWLRGGMNVPLAQKGNKDYRQQMADQRAARGEMKTKEEKDAYKDKMAGMDITKIKRQNKFRNIWDAAGRIVGAGLGRIGYDAMLTKPVVVPDDVTPTPEPSPTPPVKPVAPIESGISSDAYIRKGEGITHALKRQLENNPELAKELGIVGKPTGNDLARIARDFGYIKSDGSDVRVLMDQGAAYEIKIGKDGVPFVEEHFGGHIQGNEYVGGTTQERHFGGSIFEGDSVNGIEKRYEYIHGGNDAGNAANSGTSINPDNNSAANNGSSNNSSNGVDLNNAPGATNTGTSGLENNSAAAGEILRGGYGGHRMVINNAFDAKFNNMPSDRSVMELFNTHGVGFNQKNFNMLGYRLAENPGTTDNIFININSDNPTKLLSWKDIYEQTDFDAMKLKYPNLDMIANQEGVDLTKINDIDTPPAPELRQAFTQKTGHFEVHHDQQGSISISNDPNFEFTGETQTGDFTNREQNLIEKGKFDIFAGMPVQGDMPVKALNGARILKLKNGQYVFEKITGAMSKATAAAQGAQELDTAMNLLGMKNTVQHSVTTQIEGSEIFATSTYTPISEQQAQYIGKVYSEIQRFTGMNN